MSDLIISKMISGSFRVRVDIQCEQIGTIGTVAKIDTGCIVSVLNYRSIFNGDTNASIRKFGAVKAKRPFELGYGVETGFNIPPKPKTEEEILSSTAVKFRYSVSAFRIAGTALSANNIHINYDRVGNNLIGMDILSKMDFHCGLSLIDDEEYDIAVGDFIFVGCPYKNSTDYADALQKYFGMSTVDESVVTARLWRRYFKRRDK